MFLYSCGISMHVSLCIVLCNIYVNVVCIELQLDFNQLLDDQGRIDVILHKLTDLINRSFGHGQEAMKWLEMVQVCSVIVIFCFLFFVVILISVANCWKISIVQCCRRHMLITTCIRLAVCLVLSLLLYFMSLFILCLLLFSFHFLCNFSSSGKVT